MGYPRPIAALLDNLPGMTYRRRHDPARTRAFVSGGCNALTGYLPADFTGHRTLVFAGLLPAAGHDQAWTEAQATLTLSEHRLIMRWIQTAAAVETWFWERRNDDGKRACLNVLILSNGTRRRIVTFEGEEFDRRFPQTSPRSRGKQ